MSNLLRFERATKENKDAVEAFERAAKNSSERYDLTREGAAPSGYWYTNQSTNTAFKWFLSGLSYGKCLSNI